MYLNGCLSSIEKKFYSCIRSQGQPWLLAHFNTSKWPPRAAFSSQMFIPGTALASHPRDSLGFAPIEEPSNHLLQQQRHMSTDPRDSLGSAPIVTSPNGLHQQLGHRSLTHLQMAFTSSQTANLSCCRESPVFHHTEGNHCSLALTPRVTRMMQILSIPSNVSPIEIKF